jgi:hypothetical protein
MLRRSSTALTAVLALVLLAGCRVDATVEIDVTGGGGAVTARFRLDREAVAILGGAVGGGAQTSDLEQTGWEISPVVDRPDGGAEIEARKAFHRPSDLGVVIEELAGPEGPLRGFRLDRDRSLTKARYRVRGRVDLGVGGAAATGLGNSPDLPARLRSAGIDPGRVEELLAGRAAEGFALRLVVELPGETGSWALQPGSPPQVVDLASSVDDRLRPLLLVVAVAGAAVVAFRLRRRPAQS